MSIIGTNASHIFILITLSYRPKILLSWQKMWAVPNIVCYGEYVYADWHVYYGLDRTSDFCCFQAMTVSNYTSDFCHFQMMTVHKTQF